jgi:hypothetical protein
MGAFAVRIKRTELEADFSLPLSADINNIQYNTCNWPIAVFVGSKA